MELDTFEDVNLTFDVKEVKNKSRRGSILFNIPATNSFKGKFITMQKSYQFPRPAISVSLFLFAAKVKNEIPHSEYKKKMEDERLQWTSLIRKQKQINLRYAMNLILWSFRNLCRPTR